jgi:putative sigma-54 modulation protein
MNVKIHSIHFNTDEKLEQFINEKLQKIEKFGNRITDVQVILKLDHNKGSVKDKIAEIRLQLPGKTLYSEENSKSFEESVEMATDSIVRQIKKHKEKIQQ